jgi:hypothetical protein
MRTEDQGRIKDNLGEYKRIPSFYISRMSRLEEGMGRKGPRPDLRIFCTEILLRKLARELDQDPMGPATGVPEQVHRNVTVAELQER